MRDLTFSKFKKKEGGGRAPRAVDRLLKRLGGRGVSIVGLKKNGSPPTYGPGHMPGAQHIHLNLSFFVLNLITLIVNLRDLGLRIDYNQLYMFR